MKRIVIVIAVLAAALVTAIVTRSAVSDEEGAPIRIVHWSNSHPLRENLLGVMAVRFNQDEHETASGQRIEVVVVKCDSAAQAADLVSRLDGSGGAEYGCTQDGRPAPDPTIVTPQSDDWLVDVNHGAGRDVVDLSQTLSIAETWLGIVTYRAMAECLGWPNAELGYADIIALSEDPQGWASHSDCASTSWGRTPLVAFTNPNTSTSGRNVLVSLYSMAAQKPPKDLTLADVDRPEVRQLVTDFAQLVAHYLPATIPLNTKIVQGPRYGHFFLMPEDNLVSLYKGNEKATGRDGTEQAVAPVEDLVMIYPKEGAVLNANPAGVVDATWVTPEQADAARRWIDHLREEDQQRKFMDAGFRPAADTGLSADEQQFRAWGLDATKPSAKIEPGDLDPAVLERIIDSWSTVKRRAIVTFVVDVSGSMRGEPLEHVKTGLTRVIDAMARSDSPGNDNEVGIVTFSTTVVTERAPRPLEQAKFDIADTIDAMAADGDTALYDAIARGIELTESVESDDDAIRAVVVLSDGEATTGRCLHDIVSMSTSTLGEVDIGSFCGLHGDQPQDVEGASVPVDQVVGDHLVDRPHSDVQVFFVGFGSADINIGRILAEATGAEYQGSPEEDLAKVIEELSGYF